jgi:hypothetical protein
MTLDEEKKALIEAEERYRHEIASKLRTGIGSLENEASVIGRAVEKTEGQIWNKVLELLNSNFGMWLLSSVLLTGGAAAYQAMQHRYEIQLKNKTQIILYQFEIGNRIQNMKYFLHKSQTVGDAQFALKSVFQSKTPINPDVEKLSLSVLYYNFFQLSSHPNKEALDLVRWLEDFEYDLQSQKPNELFVMAEKEKILDLIHKLEAFQVKEASSRN